MADSFGIALLAAGKGTRMKSDHPKALVPLLGQTLIDFVIQEINETALKNNVNCHIGVVVGHKKEELISHFETHYSKRKDISFAVQKEQKGTADALRSYFKDTPKAWDKTYTLVACADTPLIQEKDFTALYKALTQDKNVRGVAATFKTDDPSGYGRIVRSAEGFKIVEEKDASEKVKLVKEVNSGLYIFRTDFLKEYLSDIDDTNASHEFYLTDLFQFHRKVEALCFEDESSFYGVNTLKQLERASKVLRRRKVDDLRNLGVRFVDGDTCYLDWSVSIGEGTVVYPQVVLEGSTQVGKNCLLEMGITAKNTMVHDDVELYSHSYFEHVEIGAKSKIGPFARLRPGTDIGEQVKVGNFVEIKKAKLHRGSKVSHLSYVGDAEVGENSNIGCGFITCNYDGKNKHKTTIGKNTFIGSDVQAVAPVEIGDNAMVGAGSTITHNVPNGAFAIARSKQVTKEDMAKKFPPFKK